MSKSPENKPGQDAVNVQLEWFHTLTIHSLDIVTVLDEQGIIRYVSPSVERLLGWKPEELIDRSAFELIHPDDRTAITQLFADKLERYNGLVTTVYRHKHKNGSWRIMESVASNLLQEPKVAGVVVNTRDVTTRIENDQALRESEERFYNAFQYAAIGMALVGIDGSWLSVNEAICNLLGYTSGELKKLTFQQLTHPDDLQSDMENVRLLLAGEISYYHMKKRYINSRGHLIWAQLAVTLVRDSDGQPLHFISQITDLTEGRRAEEQLIYDALHDSLTGLANRVLLANHVEIAFNRYLRHPDESFAIILGDLDRFKNINDTLGHPSGDLVILETAKRIKLACGSCEVLARLGGDEFAILVEDIRDENSPTRIAESLLEIMAIPMVINDSLIEITMSIGVVVVSPDHASTDELFRDADIALYRAKDLGRNSYQVFDQQMHKRIREKMELESDLRRAISRNEMVVHLQPIIALATGRINSFEALIRWNHPQRGFIPPDVFIPIAEETGFIHTIGSWMARTVCQIIKRWPSGDAPPISINVSPSEIMKVRSQHRPGLDLQREPEDFDTRIARIASEEGVFPDKLRIEITESVMISDPIYAGVVLKRLSQQGFQLLLDDFGVGYSSLCYLHDLPFFQVKLDRSFTATIVEDSRSFELLKGIVSLAHNIGMQVVAEGVETSEQLELIREVACDNAQGYHFSKPLPVNDAYELFKSDRTW